VQEAGFEQRGVKRNRVVSVGQEEAVAAFPFGIVRLIAHCAEVGDGEYIGNVECLPDITLSLHFAHQQGVSTNPIGALSERHRI
jgi:hypothetical protein